MWSNNPRINERLACLMAGERDTCSKQAKLSIGWGRGGEEQQQVGTIQETYFVLLFLPK